MKVEVCCTTNETEIEKKYNLQSTITIEKKRKKRFRSYSLKLVILKNLISDHNFFGKH